MSKPHDHPGSPHAEHAAFDPQWWEHHYREHPAKHQSPSPQLVAEVTGLPAGSALDAGCGGGADALWLAQQGWQVTAVDVSPTAVSTAEGSAAHHDHQITSRISWVVADLTTWQPPTRYDLVVSQYVHPRVPFTEFVARLAQAVAPDGTLLIVGHDKADEHSAAHAPDDASISLDAVTGSLSPDLWDVEVAEPRIRHTEHDSTRVVIRDLVVRAHRRPL
ncbi:class I SAM-dependent methyltransferase [Micromonospora sp. RHAY321]|uniref:class I SAM-dependent methyltransferase n=1 Tax=Micromonospora sp. RHAY321 TaxID=2944807 RepID=UPI00207CEE3A|nr:class I SAM-dependent methyltransferase [Micromonospora sp. RHAY321]MCO1597498.1 class I SAM-dependent methyltransferase [Micromonospora sp. RHAY321]